MPPHSDKELEERLTAAGKSLAQPPSLLDELLRLLDRVEGLLSKVEQSPPKSMQTALSPLMKALVTEVLLKHSDMDVKVGVASCISEITRITAPDAPYDDDQMKDVFQLIVSSFEDLSDVSSRSHEKRATILETVAKVRSCVIMLDLECDQMIVDMFLHFLKSIRAYHTENIFASMETIMTLVIEESEDISADLLAPILSTLRKNKQDVVPIARKLAERVIQNSADKLRPYLRQAVTSLEKSLDDYSEVLASVCQENTDTIGHSNESILKNQHVVEVKCTSASPARYSGTPAAEDDGERINFQEKDSITITSPKSVVSNGINEIGISEITAEVNTSKKIAPDEDVDAKSTLRAISDDCDAQDAEKSEAEAEQAQEANNDTPNKDLPISQTEVKPVEAAESLDKGEDSSVEAIAEASIPVEALTEASPAQSGSHPDESLSETEVKEIRLEKSVDEELVSIDIAPKKASEGESSPEVKKQRRIGKKLTGDSTNKDKASTEEVASKKDDGCASDSEAISLDQAELPVGTSHEAEYGSTLRKEDVKKSGRGKETFGKGKKRTGDSANKDKASIEEVASKNDDGCASDSEARSPHQAEKLTGASNKAEYGSAVRKDDVKKSERGKPTFGKGKRRTGDSANKDKASIEEVGSKNDDGCASDSEARSLDQAEKPVDASNKAEYVSALRKDDVKKSGRGKPTSEKDTPKSSAREDHGKDSVTPRKSQLKSQLKSTKHEGVQEETPRASTKRKLTPGKEKASAMGKGLVGSKVKVYWPADKAYYEGEVVSFDAAKKKHKVVYNDGDQEILNLSKEKWQLLEDDVDHVVSDGEQDVEHSSQDTSSDVQVKRKGNTSSETASKRQKVEVLPKSKQKDTVTKSGGKSKDDGKAESLFKENSQKPSKKSVDDKSKDQSQKAGGKGQADSAKTSGRSKEDVGKTSSHSKQDNSRTPKTKGKTPPSGKTVGSGGGMRTAKSSSSKVKDSDQMKEKTPDTAKSTETAKGKATDIAKSRESETKGGKKRRR